MNNRAPILSPHRVLAIIVVIASVAGLSGDPIRVSKPAVEIAAPAREEPKLPEARARGLDFAAPEMARPVAPQPSIIRIAPRDRDRDEEDDDRFNPRDPRRLPGSPKDEKYSFREAPTLRRDAHSITSRTYPAGSDSREKSPGKSAPSPGTMSDASGMNDERNDLLGTKQTESSRALTPVTDFDWDGRESRTKQGGISTEKDRNGRRDKGPFASPNDSEESSLRPTTFFDLLTARPKEKPSPELLERRASFEQLLNPNADSTVKTAGSLDPVSSLNAPPRPVGSSRVDLQACKLEYSIVSPK